MRILPGRIGATVGLALMLGSALAGTAAAYTLTPAGEGRRMFLKLNCYGCHGMNAGGGMAISIQHAEPGDVGEAVRSGEESGMPAFGKYVTPTDITNIAAYLASIGKANEPKFTHWWEPIPSQ